MLKTTLAVAVCAGAAMVAPPYLRAALVGLQGEQAADAVAAAMAEGRELAVARGRVVRVILRPGARLIEVDGGRWHQIPAGVTLSGPPPDGDGRVIVEFGPGGNSSGGQIVVAARHRAWSVLVDRTTGTVRRISAGR